MTPGEPPSFAELYERELVEHLFQPWAETLLDHANLAPGDRVLDVACGTGIVARLARRRAGEHARVAGIDASRRMIEVARGVAPEIEWLQGSAESMAEVGDGSFDVVACQQGLQFFARKLAAAREMRRVLAPGGRVALSTWLPVERQPFIRELKEVAERHAGAIVDPRHSFGDSKALGQLLADAGLADVRVVTLSRAIRFPKPEAFLRMNTQAIVGMSATGPALKPADRARLVATIEQDSVPVLARYADGRGLAFEISSNVATARCPPLY